MSLKEMARSRWISARRAVKSILPAIPERVREAAARVAIMPGVQGVFVRRSAPRPGARARKYMLVAHVMTRPTSRALVQHGIDPLERAPRSFAPRGFAAHGLNEDSVAGALDGSIPVQFVAVGEPRTHRLDNACKIEVPGSTTTGSLTVVAPAKDGARALLSGHVGLPVLGGCIARAYPAKEAPACVDLCAVQSDEVKYDARLVRGLLGDEHDWALVHFVSTPPASTNPAHLAAFDETPVPIRKRLLREDELVHHFSAARGRMIDGEILEFPATPLRLQNGNEPIEYRGVVVVRSPLEEAFSEPGDSGSLVVDDSHFAWGVIVGASEDGRRAYVLTLPPLITKLTELGIGPERFFCL